MLLATRRIDFRKGAHVSRRLGAGGVGRGSFLWRGDSLSRQARRPLEDIGLGYQRPGAGVEGPGFTLNPFPFGRIILARWRVGSHNVVVFGAGIEGRISVLFRGRGMKRCLAEGLERFELLVGAAVLANNLMRIAALLSKRRVANARQRNPIVPLLVFCPVTNVSVFLNRSLPLAAAIHGLQSSAVACRRKPTGRR